MTVSKLAIIALNKQLFTLPGFSDKIQLEGAKAKNTDGIFLKQFTLFGRPTLLGAFAAENPLTEGGPGGTYRNVIIYQVSVYGPSGHGSLSLTEVADSICALFPRGLRLTEGSVSVRVEQTYRASMLEDGIWIRIPVTVEAWYYTPY